MRKVLFQWSDPEEVIVKDKASFSEIMSLCLRHRCPVCKTGRLFSKTLEIERFRDLFLPLESCPVCHFRFAREPGYYFGVLSPALPILSIGAGAIVAGIAYFGFGRDIDTTLIAGASGVALGFFGFCRTAIAIYIAIDHAIDPPKSTKH